MTAWFAENLVWASAAMLLVLAIRRPVAHWFGAGIAYALWLIPALRLVAPPAGWIGSIFNPLPSLPPLFVAIDGAGGGAPLPLDGPGQWVPVLLALWAGGGLLFSSCRRPATATSSPGSALRRAVSAATVACR